MTWHATATHHTRLLLVSLVLTGGLVAAAASPQREQQQAALSKLQPYVGSWRGVGQPRRGSNRGAWRENQQWEWSFGSAGLAVTFEAKKAKYFRRGRLVARQKDGHYEFYGLLAGKDDREGKEVKYQGVLADDGKLVLHSSKIEAGKPARITIRQVADGDRMLVLYERQVVAGRYARLAEIGLTREGSNFGAGTSFVECVVTGGLGTIPVTYQGKTYYVCCSGCRDYFNDNPAEILAEYQERLAKKKK
jgi:hypothetical protein